MVKIENEDYLTEPNYVIFYKETPTDRGVYIHLVMFRGGIVAAIGGLMVKTILMGINSLGKGSAAVKRLKMLAAGGRVWGDMASGGRWKGYKSWPLYGFDMELGERTVEMIPSFAKFPKDLASCRTVSELLALDGGDAFWAMVGDGSYMEFRLTSKVSKRQLEDNLKGRFP